MITALLIYLAIAVAIPLWDAYIGFGFEFPDISEGPNAVFAGLFWPIGLPIISVICFSKFLEKTKERRIERQEHKAKVKAAKERIRVAQEQAQEKELEAAMRQVEEEIQDVKAKSSIQY